MIGAAALLVGWATAAWGCEEVEPVPESLQVAWISPIRDTARSSEYIEVVRVRDLRAWVRANSSEPVRVLQAAGMLERDVTNREAEQEYKITIFDVQRAWLCRPLLDVTPGEDISNVPACPAGEQEAADRAHRAGFTGCGYTLDTGAATRGIDVYRVTWEEASAWGFCVMPLARFLEGA